jgi:glycosyltransferase involved in cell wall biosynthesis
MTHQPHAQIVQHLQPGGIETMALDLCQFSAPGRGDVIISLEGDKETAIAQWPRLESVHERLVFLNKPNGWSMQTVWQLAQQLRRLNVAQIHTHHIGPMLYGGVASRIAGVRQWVHTEHDAWHLQNKKHRQLAKSCIRFLNPLLVADAALVAEQLHQRLPNTRACVIYNGIDTERFCPGDSMAARTRLGLPQDRQLVGCAARLHPVKGQHRLIQMLPKFPAYLELVLAGDGETRAELEALAQSLGVTERVHFLGAIDDMPNFYRAIDVFCLTSDFEGLPLSPLEAQACDTPAVVTDVGGARETVCPDSGAVVALDDATALVRAVANAFLVSASHSPREFIVRHYDVRKMVQEYASLAQIRWSA